ncbi:MAG TPA: hemerythrin domain-containing protein [Steroidobacteraceae bacterium]|jgi:Hemerythrin HHE cation binding domain.|nr:hemerythrin domain-containing protein [Steroidobacteraceae bacterium]
MARSTQTRSSDSPRDAIALLKQDHRTVSALFDEFAKADEEEQSAIAQRVCQLLTVHATIEEELLYPAAKEAFEGEEENEDLVNEAEVEHGSAKELIAKIEGMTGDDEHFKATVTVLAEYIKHHVKEEENELFPQLRKTDLDLKELGGRLEDRKLALMEQMGIEAEEEPQPRKRSAARGATRSKAANRRSGSRARH